jgi:hypothetical protein
LNQVLINFKILDEDNALVRLSSGKFIISDDKLVEKILSKIRDLISGSDEVLQENMIQLFQPLALAAPELVLHQFDIIEGQFDTQLSKSTNTVFIYLIHRIIVIQFY